MFSCHKSTDEICKWIGNNSCQRTRVGTDCCQTRFPFKSLGKHHAYDNSVEKTRIRVSISSMKVQRIARANLVINVVIFGSTYIWKVFFSQSLELQSWYGGLESEAENSQMVVSLVSNCQRFPRWRLASLRCKFITNINSLNVIVNFSLFKFYLCSGHLCWSLKLFSRQVHIFVLI